MGSRNRLVSALAFAANEIADFRSVRSGDVRVISIAAADLRAAADRFEASNKAATTSSKEKRGQVRRRREK
jgi:hypothetical protein